MKEKKRQALAAIETRREQLGNLSDSLWDHPEVGYHETFAAQTLAQALEQEGFQVQRGLAGIQTAFSGTFGSGGPVIGFLGEFDALPGLSQKADCTVQAPVQEGNPGHGCGHNLLGVGSLAAAIAVKQYLQENQIPGTVKFFGCPAEEGGSGKGFMARAGVFDGLDLAFLAQHTACLGARVVELGGLADHDRAGADDHDGLDVGAFRHCGFPPWTNA